MIREMNRLSDNVTDHVELLLQRLDLRLDLLQKTLHPLVTADGTTGRPCSTKHQMLLHSKEICFICAPIRLLSRSFLSKISVFIRFAT